ELRGAEPSRAVDIQVTASMPACGDESLLRIALENLLRNAWKFTSKTEAPTIEVGRDASGYFVRDNGVGFDPAHAERLFRAFERLHSRDEFEGTGIGLAIVHRIIQRHGGRVWANSKVGQGATFFFTLREPINSSLSC